MCAVKRHRADMCCVHNGGSVCLARQRLLRLQAHPLMCVQELQDSCCGAEHSYVHAQQLLTAAGRHENGANLTAALLTPKQCA